VTFAYADPPYIGCARRYYKNRSDFAGEVDHKELLERLYHEFPDGWALSASMMSLWDLIPMIPKSWKCRIAAWTKSYTGRPMDIALRRPAYAWEPVIWRGGRKLPPKTFLRDWVSENNIAASPGHRPHKVGKQFPGAKPDGFCYWLFDLLNMRSADTFVDLFPGTGRVTRAWEHYKKANMIIFGTAPRFFMA
jgi:hypothetical protein